MSITATDLIAPTGALTAALLTGLDPAAADAATVAATYAAVGNAKAAGLTDPTLRDAAAVAWATYRAMMDRAQQIQSAATSISSDGDGSESYSTAQAVELKKDAAKYLAAYEAAVAADGAAEPEPAPLPAISRSTPVTVTW